MNFDNLNGKIKLKLKAVIVDGICLYTLAKAMGQLF